MQAGEQYGSYTRTVERQIFEIWRVDFGLRALQLNSHVQVLANVLDDPIDLLVSHVRPR
jgi:hypothetical protein